MITKNRQNILSVKIASINQSGSLNLFSSKDVELEQRTLLLKRLAFVIYCSNEDQYQKQMPDIQGECSQNTQKYVSKAFLHRNRNFLLY